MKEEWKKTIIGEICDVGGGSTPRRTDKTLWDNGTYPWFTVEDIREQGRIISYTRQSITEKAWKTMRVFPANSVLLCCTASIGEYALTTIPITTNQQFNGLTIKDSIEVLPMFLLYYCSTLKDKLLSLSGRTTINFVSGEKVRNLPFSFPSLSEQQRIVDLLDAEFAKIDALKANAEKNLQNAKDLFQAALNKLIIGGSKGWKSTKLKTICSKIGSGATPLGGKSTYGKEGVSLIRSLNVHNNEFHYEDLAHINEEQVKQLSNVEIKENDVLFNITGASVTRCCKVPKNVLPARVNQHVSILRLLPYTLLPNFLVYTMISPHHNSALMKMAENGATRQAITKKQLEEWVIKYPETIADQQSIVSRLDTLNEKCKALQANYEKTLSLCDDLKQALLRKAFNGEI